MSKFGSICFKFELSPGENASLFVNECMTKSLQYGTWNSEVTAG